MLKVHKDDYEFKDSKGAIECDDPVMLRVLLEDIEPAVRVGAQDLIDKLETISLEEHDNDLKAFIVEFQNTYKEILLKKEEYNMLYHCFCITYSCIKMKSSELPCKRKEISTTKGKFILCEKLLDLRYLSLIISIPGIKEEPNGRKWLPQSPLTRIP